MLINLNYHKTFIAFYDKLEKYNFLLTELEKNIDEKHDERLNQKLLSDGVGDGGQWGCFVAIVKKNTDYVLNHYLMTL